MVGNPPLPSRAGAEGTAVRGVILIRVAGPGPSPASSPAPRGVLLGGVPEDVPVLAQKRVDEADDVASKISEQG